MNIAVLRKSNDKWWSMPRHYEVKFTLKNSYILAATKLSILLTNPLPY